MMIIKNRVIFLSFLIFIAAITGKPSIEAQEQIPAVPSGNPRGIKTSGTVEWDRGVFSSSAALNLAREGLKLPTGRIRGEEILEDEYPRLLRPYLLGIQADSSSTVEDLVQRGDLSLTELDILCREAQRIPSNLSADLTQITGRYTINLGRLSSLIRRGRSVSQTVPLIPVPAADYTGIIIIADMELAIHGRNSSALLKPCLFPKIWDTEMNLIYERHMMVIYAPSESIFRPTPSGLESGLESVVGSNPLRILARGVFGINPTDPVIDKEDALVILSSENNRRLLRESRIAVILNNSVLKAPVGEL